MSWLKDRDSINIENNSFKYCRIEKIGVPAWMESVNNIIPDNLVEFDAILSDDMREIKSTLFEGCRKLRDLKWSDSVTVIGDRAFQDCENLSITLLYNWGYHNGKYYSNYRSIKKIGYGAFQGCKKIDSSFFNKIATGCHIETNAFSGCTNINSIGGMATGCHIETNAFSGCTNINSIGDMAGCHIETNAFSGCTNITNLDIRQASYVARGAFDGCTGLIYAALSDSIVVGGDPFTNCTKLHIMDVYSDGKKEYTQWFCEDLFSSIDTLRLHGVKNIGDYAFQNCSNLKEISLGDSIRNIGNYAFSSVEGLTKIEIPYYAKIGDYAFQNCKNLKEVSFTAPRTFEVYVPTQLGKYVFSGCSSLEKFSQQRAAYGSPYKWEHRVGPNAIPEGGFENCTSLTSIPSLVWNGSTGHYENSLDSIGAYAFRGCTGLESINLNYGHMRKVGTGAFYGCSSAREIYINAWWYIGAQAFYGCSSAREIYINVPSIGAQTFEGCSSAETLTIGASVDSIGSNAFNGTAIKGDINIYAWSNPPVCAPDAFGDVDKSACNLVIHVPTVYDVDGNNFEESYEYQQLQEMYETSWERYLHYDEYKTEYIVSQLWQQDNEEKFSLERYKKADVWKDFYEDESIPTSIEKANMEGGVEPKPLEYYGTDGIRTTSPKKGINIVRMSDGTVRKVIF